MSATRINTWAVVKIDNGGLWYLTARKEPPVVPGGEPRVIRGWTLNREMGIHYSTYADADRQAEKYNHEQHAKCAMVLGWVRPTSGS